MEAEGILSLNIPEPEWISGIDLDEELIHEQILTIQFEPVNRVVREWGQQRRLLNGPNAAVLIAELFPVDEWTDRSIGPRNAVVHVMFVAWIDDHVDLIAEAHLVGLDIVFVPGGAHEVIAMDGDDVIFTGVPDLVISLPLQNVPQEWKVSVRYWSRRGVSSIIISDAPSNRNEETSTDQSE